MVRSTPTIFKSLFARKFLSRGGFSGRDARNQYSVLYLSDSEGPITTLTKWNTDYINGIENLSY